GDGSVLSPEQFRRLRDEMEQGFAGAANAGRPMLLEGGLKWQAMSLTPADMDFAGTKAAAAREIALAFGVPPMLLGLPGDSTHANYKEANRALWRLTVLPLAGAILSAVREGLAADFPDARLQVDLDRVPALVEDRAQLWRMVAEADFLSADEKRQMVDWS
ncbi:phage portal protein, partial [uncultured Sphingomonas sp.]|uniref:phage portal protein n=1 Tax=uncultured Sphingomonas sp. TaxID=158754 RepID=UPI0030F7C5C0